jgi:hypothetical protein
LRSPRAGARHFPYRSTFSRTVADNMRHRHNLFSIAAIVLMFLAAGCQAAPATPADRETEKYAVYSAILADVGGLPVINDRAGGVSWKDSDYDRVHDQVQQVDRAIWDELGAANAHAETLKDRFDPALGDVPVANWADLGVVFSKNKPAQAWEIFHQKYPGKCLLGLSNVGFNDQTDKALVYVSGACDEKSGGGRIVYLTRQRGKWAVQGKATIWGQ